MKQVFIFFSNAQHKLTIIYDKKQTSLIKQADNQSNNIQINTKNSHQEKKPAKTGYPDTFKGPILHPTNSKILK